MTSLSQLNPKLFFENVGSKIDFDREKQQSVTYVNIYVTDCCLHQINTQRSYINNANVPTRPTDSANINVLGVGVKYSIRRQRGKKTQNGV